MSDDFLSIERISSTGRVSCYAYNTETGFQLEARNRSLSQQYYVDTDTCGTTAERTTLYAPQLITQINNAYLSSARAACPRCTSSWRRYQRPRLRNPLSSSVPSKTTDA